LKGCKSLTGLHKVPDSIFDRQFALSRVGGDIDLLKEVAVIFLGDYPRILTELREAVLSQNAARVEEAAHTLKGSVAVFGAKQAAGAALELEQMGRLADLSQANEPMRRLERLLAALERELRAL
jgi:two-component system sensor histidine kinase/response regulator